LIHIFKEFFNKIFYIQELENEWFSNNANNLIKEYVLNNINPNEYLYFENEESVKLWSDDRKSFFHDLVDMDKCYNVADYSSCTSDEAKEIVRSVRFYRGNIHFHINRLLRRKKAEFAYDDLDEEELTIKHIINLDELFNQWPLNKKVISIRWIRTEGFEEQTKTNFDDIDVGLQIFNWGYSSSSLNLEYNKSYRNYEDPYVVLILKVDSHVSAVDTCTISCVTEEAELTLNRKAKMRVTEIIYQKHRNGIFVVEF
jgi:hypothetical protein